MSDEIKGTCQYDNKLKCWQDGCAECRVLVKYFKRRCNNCNHYLKADDKRIKGCGYIPNGKSPKRWFCPDYSPRESAMLKAREGK